MSHGAFNKLVNEVFITDAERPPKNRIRKVMSIKAPTLIIHGKDDPLIRVKNSYRIHKLIKKIL